METKQTDGKTSQTPNPNKLRCPCGANLGDCSHSPRIEDCTPIEEFNPLEFMQGLEWRKQFFGGVD